MALAKAARSSSDSAATAGSVTTRQTDVLERVRGSRARKSTHGVRATQSVDAMAVTYMVTTLIWLLVALRFVNPTQLVTRVKEQPKK